MEQILEDTIPTLEVATQKRPLLSICIPTYNRAEILKETLESIVKNDAFSNEIEVVISDNASTDNTQEIGEKYSKKYHNIKYHRNKENIRDANFFSVLKEANGEYLKLNNDWGIIRKESLSYILQTIKDNLHRRKPIFFTDNNIYTKWKKQDEVYCANIDEYVQVVSTYVTAIFIFGIWREHLQLIKNPLEYTSLMLNQVDWTFQILENQDCYIYNKPIYSKNKKLQNSKRGGYNWFEVHLDNYYTIFDKYVKRDLITAKTLKQDKRNLLFHFKPELVYTFIRKPSLWQFETDGTWNRLLKHSSSDMYLWFILCQLPFYYIYMQLLSILPKKAKLIIKKILNSFKLL